LAAKEMCRLFPDLWARRKEREGILHGQQIAVAQHDLESGDFGVGAVSASRRQPKPFAAR